MFRALSLLAAVAVTTAALLDRSMSRALSDLTLVDDEELIRPQA